MVPWMWVPKGCQAVAQNVERGGEHAVRICVGEPGMFSLRNRGACTLMSSQAMGSATPSFTSQLLQEGVTPEDEETLKQVSFMMYLGVFSKVSLSNPFYLR